MSPQRPSLSLALLLGLLLGLLSSGCMHRVIIQSDPPGAQVYAGDKLLGSTPVEVRRWVWPYRKVPVTVRLPEYRPVTVRLDRDLGPFRVMGEVLRLKWRVLIGLKPRRVHEVLMLPEHEAAGGWLPGDVRR